MERAPLIELAIETRRFRADAVVLEVEGELDVATAPELEEELHHVAPMQTAVVDLERVEFMDIATVRLLCRETERFRRQGGELVVVTGAERNRRLFELTGTDQALSLEADLADAIAHLRAA
jgi:anti-anti-sigma factor